MKTSLFRAWRFYHPDLDPPDGIGGLRISARGGVEMVEGGESVRQALFLLLSTMPGERVGRPDYGCPFHWLVFSTNDETTAGLAIHYVRRAIELWEPRVEIVSLDANRNLEHPEVLDIFLQYRVRATQSVDQITYSLSLQGEED